MLLLPAIQYNFFQRVHFSRKLSQSLINMTDFYLTLYFQQTFQEINALNNSEFLINPTEAENGSFESEVEWI